QRIAEDIRLSLTFYRTEYDRESLPRYAIGGWTDLAPLGRWLAERIGLNAPLEVMDPFKAVEGKLKQTIPAPAAGDASPPSPRALGLALRGLWPAASAWTCSIPASSRSPGRNGSSACRASGTSPS